MRDTEDRITKDLVEMVGWLLALRRELDPGHAPATAGPFSTEEAHTLEIWSLGSSLNELGGMLAMYCAADAVRERYGARGVAVVSSAWDRIGAWVAPKARPAALGRA